MTDQLRMKVAALLTALFLGAVCAAGLLTHTPAPPVAASPAQIAAPASSAPVAIPSLNYGQESHD
jgi:hypothetical protein